MLEAVKKGFYMGLGLLLVTKERAESLIDDLVKKGEISQKEGEEFVKELTKKSEEAQQEFQKKIETVVTQAIQKLDLPTKTDLEEIIRRLENIERQLEGSKKDTVK